MVEVLSTLKAQNAHLCIIHSSPCFFTISKVFIVVKLLFLKLLMDIAFLGHCCGSRNEEVGSYHARWDYTIITFPRLIGADINVGSLWLGLRCPLVSVCSIYHGVGSVIFIQDAFPD